MIVRYNEHSVELVAEDGKFITNGTDYVTAVTMPIRNGISGWTEVDEMPEDITEQN